MPTYGHLCQCGHAFNRYRKTPEYRNDPSECPACCELAPRDDRATPALTPRPRPEAAPLTDKGIRVRNPGAAPTLTMHDFVCDACGAADMNAIVDAEDGETLENHACPDCGAAMRWLPSARIDRHSERFPYYDQGLGCWVNSKQEVREIAKRRGLECMEGEGAAVMERAARLENEQDAADMQALRETFDLYENHPAYRKTWGELKDQGKVEQAVIDSV